MRQNVVIGLPLMVTKKGMVRMEQQQQETS
jgi:hypothetical protein